VQFLKKRAIFVQKSSIFAYFYSKLYSNRHPRAGRGIGPSRLDAPASLSRTTTINITTTTYYEKIGAEPRDRAQRL
jgi:hypothetical protein